MHIAHFALGVKSASLWGFLIKSVETKILFIVKIITKQLPWQLFFTNYFLQNESE